MQRHFEIAFQNRTLETQIAREIAMGEPSGSRVCILQSKPAAGLTSFLKHAAASLSDETCLTVYSNGLRKGSSLIFDDFFLSLEVQMEALSRKIERPEAFRQLVRDTLSGGLSFLLPGGGMLKPATEKAFDRIRSSYHSSESAERFSRLATEHLQDTAIVFLIDNAQYVKADDLDVFRETLGQANRNVRFILGYVDRGKADLTIDDLEDRIRSVGQTVMVSNFQQPDHLLAEDILTAAGVFECSEQARELADATERNAHRLVSAVRGLVQGAQSGGLTNLSNETTAMLRYLAAADQPLPIAVLARASALDPSVMILNENAVVEALEPLSTRSIVAWRKYRGEPIAVELTVDSDDEIVRLKADRVAMLTARNSLYRTVVEAKHDASIPEDYRTALQYSLSLDVDPARSQRYAVKLVESAIRSGSINTAQLYSDALPAPAAAGSLEVYLLVVAFLIATRQYDEALQALERAPDPNWTQNRVASVYMAICLNRCRQHAASNALLGDLLRLDGLEPALVSVLGAVQIAGLMHIGEPAAAKLSFAAVEGRAIGAGNEGYLLRNAAAAFQGEGAIALLERARQVFEQNGDQYGASTCIANIGSLYANLGDFDRAAEAFGTALTTVSAFGFRHMEEALCNLALIEIYQGRLNSAARRLEDMLTYGAPNMPKLYALNHMALLQALKGKKDLALRYLYDADALCDTVFVPVAQLRHRMNSVLIRRFLQDPVVTPDDLLEITASMKRENRTIAEEIRCAILDVWNAPTPDDMVKAYRPGFLEYWAFDALGLLPGTLLPRIAIGENM